MKQSGLYKIFEGEGQRLETGNNKPVLINDPGKVWLVGSGKIDIFSADAKGRNTTGARSLSQFNYGPDNASPALCRGA